MRSFFRFIFWIGLGLAVGAGIGLYLGWVVWPTEFTNAHPSLLAEEYRHDYALMIAATYEQDGDLASARWRVASLDMEDPYGWLLAFTVDTIFQNQEPTAIRRLVKLANDLGLRSPAFTPYLPPDEGVNGG